MQRDLPSIGERCRGRWREILPQLGIDARLLDGKHHACPVCGGKDRWRFDDLEGRGTSICNQCRGMDGVSLVQKAKGWEFWPETVKALEAIVGTEPAPVQAASDPLAEATEKRRQTLEFWRSGSRIIEDDPVDRYLRQRIGRYAPTRALRSIAATPFSGRTYPAMICGFADAHGDLAGVQRTFLTSNGHKVTGLDTARWNTGSLPEGGAVRLVWPIAGKVLGIAEGVETALSATALHGVPCWAALNANRLKVWQPPEGIGEVVIFGDADANHVGQSAAFALAERLDRAGIVTQVMIPETLGQDWNDVLKACRA